MIQQIVETTLSLFTGMIYKTAFLEGVTNFSFAFSDAAFSYCYLLLVVILITMTFFLVICHFPFLFGASHRILNLLDLDDSS